MANVPQVRWNIFKRNAPKQQPGLVARLAVAVGLASVVSLIGFWLLVSPWAFRHLHPSAVWVFNVVPATAAFLLGRHTNDHFLAGVLTPCDFCSGEDHLIRYLMLAIPAHSIFFIGAAFLAQAARRNFYTLRRGRAPRSRSRGGAGAHGSRGHR